VQRPRIPVHVGGTGPASLRRAARYEGWYGGADTPEEAKRIREEILGHRTSLGRADAPYEFTVLLFWAPNPEQIDAYAAVGVDQWVVTPWAISQPVDALERIEAYATEIGLPPPPP